MVALALAAAACDTIPTAPTEVPGTTTETFTGTLEPGGRVNHPFTVTAAGGVTVQLTNLNPLDTPLIGLAVGQWDGSACSIVVKNDRAGFGTLIQGNAGPGGFCVSVYDVGNLLGAVSYTVVVIHP